MKLGDISPIVQDYIDDTSAVVTYHITDAVNFLSSIFPLRKISTSVVTTAGQAYLTPPTKCLKVRRLTIDGEEIPEASFEDLATIYDNSVQRWYWDDGKIQLTQAPTATGTTTKIWYDKAFTIPATAVDTDVPDELLELVYVGAAWRYWRKINSIVAYQREKYPDINPPEAQAVRDSWKNEFEELLIEMKKNYGSL